MIRNSYFAINTGRQYDEMGNLLNWWDNETRSNFIQLKKCFIEQYESIEVPHTDGMHVGFKRFFSPLFFSHLLLASSKHPTTSSRDAYEYANSLQQTQQKTTCKAGSNGRLIMHCISGHSFIPLFSFIKSFSQHNYHPFEAITK